MVTVLTPSARPFLFAELCGTVNPMRSDGRREVFGFLRPNAEDMSRVLVRLLPHTIKCPSVTPWLAFSLPSLVSSQHDLFPANVVCFQPMWFVSSQDGLFLGSMLCFKPAWFVSSPCSLFSACMVCFQAVKLQAVFKLKVMKTNFTTHVKMFRRLKIRYIQVKTNTGKAFIIPYLVRPMATAT